MKVSRHYMIDTDNLKHIEKKAKGFKYNGKPSASQYINKLISDDKVKEEKQ